ncbi:receptor-like protein Cf-9 homolog [Ziziphus jujuba]|uniref:Receptor-like protein Cf-9 homolog n=1 Tax=Ziziphus jujuba TaxID=326968 RepID=A0ABM3ZRY0_ZIZJJ|nr:receptor-like protein Cf-9 homolog [Ziziphus jujuba]
MSLESTDGKRKDGQLIKKVKLLGHVERKSTKSCQRSWFRDNVSVNVVSEMPRNMDGHVPLSIAPSPFPSIPSCHIDDSKALLQFKNSFSLDHTLSCGLDLPSTTISWTSGTDCCGWSGITCNNITGHVIGLDLTCGMLRGIIHSNSSLFLLRHLQILILSSKNDFRGSTIPPEFGKFEDLLHLEIWFANFAGDIPLEISYLSKLQTLEVHDENQQLRLNASTFKRIITNLTNLQNLTLDFVDMSCVDLASLMNLSSSLTSLYLWDCGLRNSPNAICHLPKLEFLYLSGDENLTGSLPKYNWSSSLRELGLSGTNFSIDILDLTRNWKSLDGLYLSNCRPNSKQNLQVLDLRFNLRGHDPIPPASIEIFLVSNNQLTGEVPISICNLKSLQALGLAHNSLNGNLPPCIGDLSGNLVILDIWMNKFDGMIPTTLFAKQCSLKNLNLNGNQLEGFLPHSLLDYFLSECCGSWTSHRMSSMWKPLNEACSNVDKAQQGGDEYEQTNEFGLWKIVVMGYGCGMVIGISIGYMMLSDRRIALFLGKLGGDRWIRRIRL